MVKKVKKYEILGGIKVSSNQLSEWGKTGGRPKKYQNNAERAKAFRLRKKQKKLGKDAQLRPYCVAEKPIEFKSSLKMVCDKCHTEVIGGPQHLGGSCWQLFCGKLVVKGRK